MYDEDEPVLYIRIVLISIGPGLRELPRLSVPRNRVNKGKKRKNRSLEMPRSSSNLFVCSGRFYDNYAGLVDEVEDVDHLGSTRFEALFAPHTRVLPRAAGDGVPPRCRRRELRVNFHAL